MMAPLLTSFPPAVGCYVDGARGIYAVDAIVALAEAFGFEAKDCEDVTDGRCADGQHEAGDGSYTEWGHCQFANEVEDEATEYLNEHHGVEDCHWGRSEQGDWGLWPNEEEASKRICPTCDAGDPTSIIPYADCECNEGGQA